MKKLSGGILLALILSVPCFAGAIVDKPTASIGINQTNLSGGGQAVSFNYFGVGIETPLTYNSQWAANVAFGNNNGVNSTSYTLSYKFELGK